MKKRSLLYFSLLIITFILLEAHLAGSLNIRVLGDVSNSKYLFDNVITKKNYTEFKYKEGKDISFILSLDSQKYIKSITVYFLKDHSPRSYDVEFSHDLFKWKKINTKKSIKGFNSDINKVEYPTYNSAARFIRLNFKSIKNKTIRISEIKIEINNKIKVNKAKIEVLKKYDHSVRLKFKTDVETMSIFKYGESISSLRDGPVVISYSSENIVNITGLLKGTEYYILGIAKDCNGNMKYSSAVRVKTTGNPLPLIKGIKAVDIQHNGFSLDFKSNVDTKYDIYYGYSTGNLKKMSYSRFRGEHRVDFKDLKPETSFFYKVVIIDKYKNKK